MRQNAMVALAAVTLMAAVAGLGLWLRATPEPPVVGPRPERQTPEEVVRYLASPAYEELDPKSREAYFEGAVNRFDQENVNWPALADPLSEEERQRLQRNARPLLRQMMERRVDRYFELPPEERTAYLDEMIDQMEARFRAAHARRARSEEGPRAAAEATPDRGPPHPRRGRFTPARLKQIIENTPPEKRARFVEFMKVARRRRIERGIKSFRERMRSSRP